MKRRALMTGAVVAAAAACIAAYMLLQLPAKRSAPEIHGRRDVEEEAPELMGRPIPATGVRVRVSDEHGKPIANAICGLLIPASLRRIASESDYVKHPTSEADGEYVFEGITFSCWEVRVLAPGYRGHAEELLIESAGTEVRADVALKPWATLTVSVMDASGAAVRGARVRLLDSEGMTPHPGICHHRDRSALASHRGVVSDDRGTVILPCIPGEVAWTIDVDHGAHAPAHVTVHDLVWGECRAVKVVLEPPTEIVGFVDFPMNARETIVTLFGIAGNTARQEGLVRPDAKGRFSFRNIPPGAKSLAVSGEANGWVYFGVMGVVARMHQRTDVGSVRPDEGVPVTVIVTTDDEVPRGTGCRLGVNVTPLDRDRFPEDTHGFLVFDTLLPIGREVTVGGIPAGNMTMHSLLVDADGESLTGFRSKSQRIVGVDRDLPVEILFERIVQDVFYGRVSLKASPPPGVTPAAFEVTSAVFGDGVLLGGSTPLGPPFSGVTTPVRECPSAEIYLLSRGWIAGPVPIGRVVRDTRYSALLDEWRRGAELLVRVTSTSGRVPREALVQCNLIEKSGEISDSYLGVFDADRNGRVRFTVFPGREYSLDAHASDHNSARDFRVVSEEAVAGRVTELEIRLVEFERRAR